MRFRTNSINNLLFQSANRGILKKAPGSTYLRKPETNHIGVRGQSAVSMRGAQRNVSAHVNIRDSVDLAREQISDRSVQKSKVRKWNVSQN